MAFGVFKILKGLLIKEENSLSPKQIQITPGGTAGTTVEIVGNQTGNQTLNLPAGSGTDTLTANAASQTLTNKTITAGVLSGTLSSNSTPNASVGTVRLPNKNTNASNSKITWRNAGDTDNYHLTLSAGDSLEIGNGSLSQTFVNPNGLILRDKDDASPSTVYNGIDGTKALRFDVSNITTGTTRQAAFPDANITVASTATSQTLSNKTLDNTNAITVQDSNLTIQDNSDNTKQLKFEVSGVTTGTTRTLTAPNANTTIVGTDASQTLSNKTFSDAPILAEIATPSTPSSGFGKIYFKSDGFLYQLNDDGTETKVGAGSGGINYITNGDAESNTTGWSAYSDAASSRPTDGNGGSPNVTITRSTSSPLRGVASFLLTKDAANRQGQGISYDFTIADADKAKPLQIDFDWTLASGTFAGSVAPATDSDVIVYLYDVTNSLLIEPSGRLLEPAVSGTNYHYRGIFQTSSNSTSYRLIFHVASTSASAYTLKFDAISVGPQIIANGAAVSDWVSFVPTGSWTTNTTYSGFYRRVADSMEVQVKIALSGAPNAATLTVNMPSGYSMDSNKLVSTNQNEMVLGQALMNDAGSAAYYAPIGYSSSTAVSVQLEKTDGSYLNATTQVSNSSPASWGNTDNLVLSWKAPISGWSGNVQLSNDTDTRVVAFSADKQAPTGSNGAVTVFGTVTKDSHTAYNTSTGRYTVPVSGYYEINAMIEMTTSGTNTVNSIIYPQIRKNGTVIAGSGALIQTTTGSLLFPIPVSHKTFCNAGDLLDIITSWNTAGTPTYTTTITGSSMSINRLSGPSQIAASESITAIYAGAGSGTIAHNTFGPYYYLDFPTKQKDSHNAVTGAGGGNTTTAANTWRFFAPISGIYQVNVNAVGTISSSPHNQFMGVYIYVSGTLKKSANLCVDNPGYFGGPQTVTAVAQVQMLAGQYLNVGLFNYNSLSGAMTIANENSIEITRIGNY